MKALSTQRFLITDLPSGTAMRRRVSKEIFPLHPTSCVLLYFCNDRNNGNKERKINMNWLLATYLGYLAISVALTVWVARTLHKNGRIFLVDSFLGHEQLADSVNH